MKNITNLNIFETNLIDGPMRLKYEYFPEITGGVSRRKITDDMTEEMKEEFLKIRLNAGEKYGFDGKKIIVPSEEDRIKKGDYFIADKDIYNMDDDLWNVDIPGDIVLLKENNPGIVIAYPVSDDPVLIIEDPINKITGLTHCNIDRISSKIPIYAVNALIKETQSDPKNLKVYISSHIKKESNAYIRKPKSVRENREIWRKCISHRKNKKNNNKANDKQIRLYRTYNDFLSKISSKIDQEKAIINMLVKKGINIDNITVSKFDTYKEPLYYSDRTVYVTKEECIKGKFLVGAYYENTFPEYNSKCEYTGKSLIKKL